MNNSHYMHIPGTLSRRGVLEVGHKRPHSCLHCFYRDPAADDGGFGALRHAPWRPTGQLLRQVEMMAENGFVTLDITQDTRDAAEPGTTGVIG